MTDLDGSSPSDKTIEVAKGRVGNWDSFVRPSRLSVYLQLIISDLKREKLQRNADWPKATVDRLTDPLAVLAMTRAEIGDESLLAECRNTDGREVEKEKER